MNHESLLILNCFMIAVLTINSSIMLVRAILSDIKSSKKPK